jgi:transporter family-2 protein
MNNQELGFTLLTILIGGGTACQVSINWSVGQYFKISSFGAVLNLGLGLLLLTIATLLEVMFSHDKLSWLAWKERPRLHHLLPGVCGVVYVGASVYLTGFTGIALFLVLIVTGQLLCSALLDHLGVGRTEPKPLTPLRALALLAGVGGACLHASTSLLQPHSSEGRPVPQYALALASIATALVGAAMVVQALLSRLAASILPSRLAATWWSFVVSFSLSLAVFIPQAVWGVPQASRDVFMDPSTWVHAHPWLFSAGFFGVAYILSSITIPPYTSSQSYFVCLVCGQLLFSTIIEHFGWFGRAPQATPVLAILGVVTVALAATAMQIPPERCPQCSSCLPSRRYSGGGGGVGGQGYTELTAVSERLLGEREPSTLE